jgi:hypothetical protein
VAEGSYALGGALPHLYSTLHGGDPIEDQGFEAHLLATKPIRDVIQRYRSQATDAGFVMAPVTCGGTAADLRCATSCQVQCGLARTESYQRVRTLLIMGAQRTSPPLSYIFIDHRLIGDPPYPSDDFAPSPDETPERGSVPREWPTLPKVGEKIISYNDFEVAEGTVLLAHGLGITEGERTAIFEVTDDIEAVIDRFTSQPGHRSPDDPDRRTLRRGGQRIVTVSWSDGRSQLLTFHDLRDGPTILVLNSDPSD